MIQGCISTDEDDLVELRVIKHWRAHLIGITSATYVETHDMILTGSRDSFVRLWTLTGQHVGTFGDTVWNFADPSLGKLPRDLQHEIEIEKRENEFFDQHENRIKKQIIENLRQAIPKMHELEANEDDASNQVEVLKGKAVKVLID